MYYFFFWKMSDIVENKGELIDFFNWIIFILIILIEN